MNSFLMALNLPYASRRLTPCVRRPGHLTQEKQKGATRGRLHAVVSCIPSLLGLAYYRERRVVAPTGGYNLPSLRGSLLKLRFQRVLKAAVKDLIIPRFRVMMGAASAEQQAAERDSDCRLEFHIHDLAFLRSIGGSIFHRN